MISSPHGSSSPTLGSSGALSKMLCESLDMIGGVITWKHVPHGWDFSFPPFQPFVESDCHGGVGVAASTVPIREGGLPLLINWKYLLWSANLLLDQTVLAEKSPCNDAGTPGSYAGMGFYSLSSSFQLQVDLHFCVTVGRNALKSIKKPTYAQGTSLTWLYFSNEQKWILQRY